MQGSFDQDDRFYEQMAGLKICTYNMNFIIFWYCTPPEIRMCHIAKYIAGIRVAFDNACTNQIFIFFVVFDMDILKSILKKKSCHWTYLFLKRHYFFRFYIPLTCLESDQTKRKSFFFQKQLIYIKIDMSTMRIFCINISDIN